MIEVHVAATKAEIDNCIRLRMTVFVEEQGFRPSEEVDAHDSTDAVHALATIDGVPCGAARFIFVEKDLAKIQRMAVIDDVRGKGVGRELLAFLEREARSRGATRFFLWAQLHARPFYEKSGYAASGEVFDDGGSPHIRMDKSA
jgi:predicted GNAT family N-acyltransferase